jgi:para-nitrobenzyl esterase
MKTYLTMFLALATACYGGSRETADTALATSKSAPDVQARPGEANDTTKVGATSTATPARSELAGTTWRLVKIQSMADSTFTPNERSGYTIEFGANGRAAMRVDCNRGSASWTSSAPGHVEFGLAAVTRAMCPPGSLHDRFLRDLPYFRSYVLRDGHLHLATMADGAIYEFEPLPSARDD